MYEYMYSGKYCNSEFRQCVVINNVFVFVLNIAYLDTLGTIKKNNKITMRKLTHPAFD